jgi:hypothetical protein
MARSTGTISIRDEFSVTTSENKANMNPFNPAKSFDITHNIYIPMKEETFFVRWIETSEIFEVEFVLVE